MLYNRGDISVEISPTCINFKRPYYLLIVYILKTDCNFHGANKKINNKIWHTV